MNRLLFRAGVVVAWCVLANAAGAMPYRNPALLPGLGDWPAGVGAESARRPVTVNGSDGTVDWDSQLLAGAFLLPVPPAGLLGVQAGMLTGSLAGGPGSRGTLVGVSYHHRLGGADRPQGLLFAVHSGYLGNDTAETRLIQAELGYGMARALGGGLTGYLGGVASRLTGTVHRYGSGARDFVGANPIGFFAGVELAAGPYLKFGSELHLVHETAIGLYAAGRF